MLANALATFPNIVCVDDGSSDDSSAQIGTTGARLVRHPVNLGQGAALQTGIEYARRQPGAGYFVTFDADGQHQVADVLRMLDRLRHEDAGHRGRHPVSGRRQPHPAGSSAWCSRPR